MSGPKPYEEIKIAGVSMALRRNPGRGYVEVYAMRPVDLSASFAPPGPEAITADVIVLPVFVWEALVLIAALPEKLHAVVEPYLRGGCDPDAIFRIAGDMAQGVLKLEREIRR